MSGPSVFAAVSGGVDSSVAAALLMEQGYACCGIFMITHDQAGHAQSDAQRVCNTLGIPLHVLDLRTEFERIINYFCDTYQSGQTPNPCVYCNRTIKFGLLWDYAEKQGADFIATGHYASICGDNGPAALYQARDAVKDQSYVLSMIRRPMLDHILLPMSDLTKDQTRRLAAQFGLPTQHKQDSQEICFIPDNNYIDMLHQWRPDIAVPGKVVDTAGNVLGEHEGIHRFTIGQRRGLGIALGKPAYVVKIDPETATVTLGGKEDLMHHGLKAGPVNWLIDPPVRPFEATVKIRYNHNGAKAFVRPQENTQNVEIIFNDPIAAITPGQAAVIYIPDSRGLKVAGGGWIQQII